MNLLLGLSICAAGVFAMVVAGNVLEDGSVAFIPLFVLGALIVTVGLAVAQ